MSATECEVMSSDLNTAKKENEQGQETTKTTIDQ
jgi:hypothetical protein